MTRRRLTFCDCVSKNAWVTINRITRRQASKSSFAATPVQPPSPDPLAEKVCKRLLASAPQPNVRATHQPGTASQETEDTSEKDYPKDVGVVRGGTAPDEGKEAVRVSRSSLGSGWYNHGGGIR